MRSLSKLPDTMSTLSILAWLLKLPDAIAKYKLRVMDSLQGEGRQSIALAGWGSSGLISNQPDTI
ncbi:hypothetical protein [uncultured Nostoc sp.]|uniref:hypothetical protein n=1 Tax=uncultured Nostoc sp. TaxID=340711 RepID=UPI0035CB5B48